MKTMTTKLLVATIFFIFSSFFRTTLIRAEGSYELFWPIVAGRTVEDPLYTLKTLKEKIRGAFIFSDLKKAEYSLFLSEKRLVEFENLVKVKNDQTNAKKTLDALNKNHKAVVNYVEKAEKKNANVVALKQRILNSFGNQTLVLKDILNSLEDDLRESVSDTVSFLELEEKSGNLK